MDMTYKEWTAVVQVGSGVAVAVWLWRDVDGVLPATVELAAQRTLWALGGAIVLNIVLLIVLAILVSIARGEELKDERADERDNFVGSRSMRNGYVVASVGGLGLLIFLATGGNPVAAPYILFGALMVAGVTDAVSRLVYYRIG
jgi:protein-S-isoprenylcysteine O-methyltransferase Ste14